MGAYYAVKYVQDVPWNTFCFMDEFIVFDEVAICATD